MNKLYLVGNHIGNVKDFPVRSVEKLEDAALVVYESIDQFRMLIQQAGINISSKTIKYDDANVLSEVIDALQVGDVALVTDLGYPMIADVGYPISKHVVDSGYEVTVIPGPTISAAANIVTVFDHFMTDFMFQEFMGLSSEQRLQRLNMIKDMPYNLVILDHPTRIAEALDQVGEVFGNRPAALVSDLTLPTEQVIRAEAKDLKDLWINLTKDIPATRIHETTIVVRGYLDHD